MGRSAGGIGSMTVVDAADLGMLAAEIVPGDASGGTNTSHTIVVASLSALLEAVPNNAPHAAYEHAAIEANVLGKDTDGARRRTFRYRVDNRLRRAGLAN